MKKFKRGWVEIQQVPETSFDAMILDTKYVKNIKSLMWFLKKWSICNLIHRHWKCYPGVDIPFDNEDWHCCWCSPCSIGFFDGNEIEIKKQLKEQRKHDQALIDSGLKPHWYQNGRKIKND